MEKLLNRTLIIFGLYLTLLLLTMNAHASQLISGNLVLNNSTTYLKLESNPKPVLLLTANEDLKDALLKLKHGDFITGSASVRDDAVVLEAIEYVGLQRLIGTWQSDKRSLMKFKNYTSLIIQSETQSTSMQYAVMPGEDNVWKVYFSDEQSVVLGTLELKSKNSANLTIYGGADGSATSLNLQKINNK